MLQQPPPPVAMVYHPDGMVFLFLFSIVNWILGLMCLHSMNRKMATTHPYELVQALTISEMSRACVCVLALMLPSYLSGTSRATISLFVATHLWVPIFFAHRLRKPVIADGCL